MTTVSPNRARGVFPALDGLRIVAVVAVVATHAAFWTGRYSQGTGRAILAHLDVGVAVFFVISGFLISREWLSVDRETGGLPRLGAYAFRRGMRILPMYWLTVIVVLAADPDNRARGVTNWLRQLFLLQAYGADQLADGLTQTWSLCTEVAFYAVLPGIAWVIVRLAKHRDLVPGVTIAVAVALTLASLGWVAFFRLQGGEAFLSAGYWLPTSLGWFMAGTALAAVRQGADSAPTRTDADGAVVASRWRLVDGVGDSPGVCVLVALAAFAAAFTPMTGDPLDPAPSAGQGIVKSVLYLIVGLALVTPAVLGRGAGYDAVLGHPVMRYLGRISYSIFLVHLALLEGITGLLDQPVFTGSFATTFALTLGCSTLLAAVTYRVVERPALRFAHRNRRSQTLVAADPRPVVLR